MKSNTLMAAVAAVIVSATAASAVPVHFTWTDTLGSGSNVPGSVVGETITTTITMDNGGSSLFSGSWSFADFVSYRIEGLSGWWAETMVAVSGSGSFQTDASGDVTSAITLYGGYPSGPVTTSWEGATTGGFWNNGANAVFCTASSFSCVLADNVQENLRGSSWSASLGDTTPIPIPATLPLLVAGLGGLAGLRRLKKKAA